MKTLLSKFIDYELNEYIQVPTFLVSVSYFSLRMTYRTMFVGSVAERALMIKSKQSSEVFTDKIRLVSFAKLMTFGKLCDSYVCYELAYV